MHYRDMICIYYISFLFSIGITIFVCAKNEGDFFSEISLLDDELPLKHQAGWSIHILLVFKVPSHGDFTGLSTDPGGAFWEETWRRAFLYLDRRRKSEKKTS